MDLKEKTQYIAEYIANLEHLYETPLEQLPTKISETIIQTLDNEYHKHRDEPISRIITIYNLYLVNQNQLRELFHLVLNICLEYIQIKYTTFKPNRSYTHQELIQNLNQTALPHISVYQHSINANLIYAVYPMNNQAQLIHYTK